MFTIRIAKLAEFIFYSISGSVKLVSLGQTLYQTQCDNRVWSSEGGALKGPKNSWGKCGVNLDTRLPQNANWKRLLVALLSHFAFILENEAERNWE